METLKDIPAYPLTLFIIAAVVSLLAFAGVKVYGWIRAQVASERSEWERSYDDSLQALKADNLDLRNKVNALSLEVHDLQNGKAKALRLLGRALGATAIESVKQGVDAAIEALSPSS